MFKIFLLCTLITTIRAIPSHHDVQNAVDAPEIEPKSQEFPVPVEQALKATVIESKIIDETPLKAAADVPSSVVETNPGTETIPAAETITASDETVLATETITVSDETVPAAEIVPAVESESSDIPSKEGEQGQQAAAISCAAQAYPSRPPLCVRLPGNCPSGYRSVFWDTGCPASDWRCCI